MEGLMNIAVGVGVDLEQLQQAATPDVEAPTEPVVCPMPKRKRARVKGGQFAADDPATAADEA
jgi:hypothetical protein